MARPPRHDGQYHGVPPRAPLESKRYSPSHSTSETEVSSVSAGVTSGASFQMVDVTVSVDVLEGIVMDIHRDVANNVESDMSDNMSFQSGYSTGVIMSDVPISAVVSCFKNVTSSETSIATHIPSLPLRSPTVSSGNSHQFMARWPSDFDPMGDALSTFKFSRVMKREHIPLDIAPGEEGHELSSGFTPEKIKLKIGLMRGSEIITLGSTNLIIACDEMQETEVHLPINVTKEAVKGDSLKKSGSFNLKKSGSFSLKKKGSFALKRTESLKRTSSKLFGKSSSGSKLAKPLSFPSDPKRKYKLDENSLIQIYVSVVPREKDGFETDIHGNNYVKQSDLSVHSGSVRRSSRSSGPTSPEPIKNNSSFSNRSLQSSRQRSKPASPSRVYPSRFEESSPKSPSRTQSTGHNYAKKSKRFFDCTDSSTHVVQENNHMTHLQNKMPLQEMRSEISKIHHEIAKKESSRSRSPLEYISGVENESFENNESRFSIQYDERREMGFDQNRDTNGFHHVSELDAESRFDSDDDVEDTETQQGHYSGDNKSENQEDEEHRALSTKHKEWSFDSGIESNDASHELRSSDDDSSYYTDYEGSTIYTKDSTSTGYDETVYSRSSSCRGNVRRNYKRESDTYYTGDGETTAYSDDDYSSSYDEEDSFEESKKSSHTSCKYPWGRSEKRSDSRRLKTVSKRRNR